MIGKFYIFFCTVFIFYAFELTAQQPISQSTLSYTENKIGERYVWIQRHAVQDSIYMDSLSIVPGSLVIKTQYQDTIIDSSYFDYNYSSGWLRINPKVWEVIDNDSLQVSYRTMSFSFQTEYSHHLLKEYDSTAFFDDVRFGVANLGLEREELFSTPNLQKSGSISRGVSFGNRQDVFVNADLNLQLEGALTDDLNIRAAITDQNIPLQPEGNTQQLQDFDNVLIELYNDRFQLQAGDVLLQSSPSSHSARSQDTLFRDLSSHFLKYRRNVQGGQLRYAYLIGKNGKAETSIGAALSKGKFASVTLLVQEGVQGPYLVKAPGNNQRGVNNAEVGNAFYILANSEKVYLDGKLLARGYDLDYVIDYNLGEITFTAKVLITKYSRVSIDFEYADRTYSRSILNVRHYQKHEKVAFYMDYYREKDNPNQALMYDLDNEDKQLLSEIGDDLSSAYVLAVDSVTGEEVVNRENAGQTNIPAKGTLPEIFYAKKDTLVGETIYQFFEYTTRKQGVYRVSFSQVGLGKGDYTLSASTVNGRVYEWVAPVNGQKQGSYAPVRLISTPKNKQVLILGTELFISEKDKIFAEVALSNNDINMFSDLDAADDKGHALKVGYQSVPRNISFLEGYEWTNKLSYEYRQKDFSIIDPYRSIEFERDWSGNLPGNLLPQSNTLADDHVLDFSTRIYRNNDNHLEYHLSARNRGELLKGMQNHMQIVQQLGQFQINADGFFMHASQYDFLSDWKRLNINAYWRTNFVMPGYSYRIDKNTVHSLQSDSIQYSAMNFEEHQFYLQSSDSLSGNFRIDYSLRTDQAPYQGKLVKSDQSHTINTRYHAKVHKDHQLELLFTYRAINNLNDSLNLTENHVNIQNGKEESILGKVAWTGSLLKNSIRSTLDYAIGNGRELKREFIYVKVPTGEGPYTWRDENGNGVEEINEFYEAINPDERNYARVYISTGEYILAYTNTFNYRLNLTTPGTWNQDKGVRKMLSLFSANASWSMDRKTDDPGLGKRLNPFATVADENLLFVREVMQSTLFFNRRNPTFGIDYNVRQSRRKQLLNVGFDERELDLHQLNIRYNIQKIWQLQWQFEKEQSISILQSAANNEGKSRNYKIESYAMMPELTWQPSLNFRLKGKYRYDKKEDLSSQLRNTSSEDQQNNASIHIVGLETRWSKMIQNSLNASLEFVNIQYEGEENTAVAYEMLEALRPGNNLRWTLNWQQKIIDGLQLSINYFGRKSPNQAIIHTGGLQVRALF